MDVLILDDDANARQAFERALVGAGYSVHLAATATEAFLLLRKQRMDAIVCDFAMPDVDGSTVHAHLVEHSPELADRIVFVTGWGQDEKTRKLLEFTGRPVLAKPVELDALVGAVRTVSGG